MTREAGKYHPGIGKTPVRERATKLAAALKINPRRPKTAGN
jgi:hypothetical protein